MCSIQNFSSSYFKIYNIKTIKIRQISFTLYVCHNDLRLFKLPNIGSKKKNMAKVTCKNLQKFRDKIFKSNGVKKTEESYSWEDMEYY